MRSLFVLFLATTSAALAGTAPESKNLLRDLSSPWISSWAIADLNGDQQVDLVTADRGRHDAKGYSHQVGIRFGGSPEEDSFTFRGHTARVRLSIRDIDGDHDGDIVILEASSQTAVGVWLNDGFGHFHEEDVATFRAALSHTPWSLCRPLNDDDPAAAAPEQRADPAVPVAVFIEPGRALGSVERETGFERALIRYSDRRPRAPPASA